MEIKKAFDKQKKQENKENLGELMNKEAPRTRPVLSPIRPVSETRLLEIELESVGEQNRPVLFEKSMNEQNVQKFQKKSPKFSFLFD